MVNESKKTLNNVYSNLYSIFLNIVTFLGVSFLFIYTIILSKNHVGSPISAEDISWHILLASGIFIAGVIWMILISISSIIVNKYIIQTTPDYENDPCHKWFKYPFIWQLIDILVSCGLILLYFWGTRFIFKRFMGKINKSANETIGLGIGYTFINKIARLLGLFSPCKTINKKTECNTSLFCNWYPKKTVSKTTIEPTCRTAQKWLQQYNDSMKTNITVLNAFLTVMFQTKLKNKISFFMRKYLYKDNIFQVESQSNTEIHHEYLDEQCKKSKKNKIDNFNKYDFNKDLYYQSLEKQIRSESNNLEELNTKILKFQKYYYNKYIKNIEEVLS